MIVCYDLRVCPPTFDFVGFLCAVALEFPGEPVDIRIIPGVRDDGLPPPQELRADMMRNIVMPMARMYRHARSVEIDGTAEGWGVGRKMYGLRHIVRALRARVYPLARAAEQTGDVTVTIRDAPYWPQRNSFMHEWAKVIEATGATVIPDKGVSMDDRASAYASARVNLFVNGGPAWFCAAMGRPTVIANMIADTPATTERFFASAGLPVGSELPNVKFVWEGQMATDIIDLIGPFA